MKRYGQRYHHCRVNEYQWRGQQLIVMENELLRVGVLASKGADIVEFRYKPRDLDVLWHAPQALLSPTEYVPTVARRAGAFLDYYAGGWQEIFPSAGPGTVLGGAELGQHGEVSLLPWDVRVVCDTPERLEVEFSVQTCRTPFRVVRKMILEGGVAELRFEEQVSNEGEEALPFAWGHHPVFGAPFLAEGCRIELPPCQVEVPAYSEGLNRRFAMASSAAPELPGLDGQLHRLDIVPSKESRTEDVILLSGLGEGWYRLCNPELKLAARLLWDIRTFPYLWSWQMYGGHWGYPDYGRSYALGLEPFNCPIFPLAECVERNVAQVLQPGETVETNLEMSMLEI
jgi:hypothetical protein